MLMVYASLAMLPSVALAYYIAVFGVNVVFWDEWEMVPLLEKLNQGRLSITDLISQHNEHRPLFPNLLTLVTEKLTGFNTTVEMFLGWLLLTLTAGLLLYVYWVKSHKDPKVLLFFLPASFLLFSFRQYESVLWGFTSLEVYLLIFATAATFTLLDDCQKSARSFVLALVAATVASFSMVGGLSVWPVGLLQILMRDRGKDRRQALTWIITWSVVTGVYFYGWVPVASGPASNYVSYVFAHPSAGAIYFLSLVGAPLSFSVKTAAVVGSTGILISALILRQARRTNILQAGGVFLSLTLFGALSDLLTTVGRSSLGVELALSSRYTPVTSVGIIGVYLLASLVVQKSSGAEWKRNRKAKSERSILVNRSVVVRALLVLFLIGLIVPYRGGWLEGANWRSAREMGAYVLKTYRIQSDESIQTYVYPSATVVRERAGYLEQNGLNVFGEPTIVTSSLTSIGSDTYFALETIDGQAVSQMASPVLIHADQGGTITITGWAVDKQANATARAVFLTIDGKLDLPTLYGGDRPDVAAAYGNPHLEYSGYIATFSSLILPKGQHTLSLEIVALNGPYFYYEQDVAYFVLE
jgi:hypothetical protein